MQATRLAAAEWYPDGQHGGVVSALMTRAVEQTPSLTPMQISRVTVELFRVVPVALLEVVATIIREGKRIQTSEVRLYAGETEVARGLIQRLRITELNLPSEVEAPLPAPAGPEGLKLVDFSEIMPLVPRVPISFGQLAVQVREVRGSFTRPGPATVWFRFTRPLVAGEPLSATQRAVLAADFSNGLSQLADGGEWVFMNSDLSVHLARPAEGAWIALDGESMWEAIGRGVATSHLFDVRGPIGRATQTLFLDRSPGDR